MKQEETSQMNENTMQNAGAPSAPPENPLATGADREALLHDIALIRQAVKSSQSVLRRIPIVSGLRPVLLLTGLLVLLFCGGKYLLDVLYGDAAPSFLHVLLNAVPVVGGIAVVIMMMGVIAIFDMREMIIGAIWLIGCGYALLWFMKSINPWLAMVLEFSVPMLLMWAVTKQPVTDNRKRGDRS